MTREHSSGTTAQEDLLIGFTNGAHDVVATGVAHGISQGQSPSFLSVARPDLLLGFAEVWHGFSAREGISSPQPEGYKAHLFNVNLDRAADGDPAAIGVLPKMATSAGQLTVALEVALEYQDLVREWRTGRPYLQYLGTFDPQHIGHRIALQSALGAEERSSAIVHVMGGHPTKRSFSAPYDERYRASEQRLYTSPLIDNDRVTQVDVPGGTGLANQGLAQMGLLADLSGDRAMRWFIGSDKLILDADKIRRGEPADKAVARLIHPNMHVYVLHRQFDEIAVLEGAIDYIADRFGTPITLVRELPYDCAPASSTEVKRLRSEGRNDEADHMEFYELPR